MVSERTARLCVDSLSITPLNSLLNAFKCRWGICRKLGHSVGNPLMAFSYKYKSSFFPNVVPHGRILPKFWIRELGRALLYWQLCDHKLFFIFSVCISSSCFLIPHCCCSAERIWNIYQGIVCWRHNFDMVMLLAFEITVCNGGQNNLSVENGFYVFASGMA